MKIDSRLMIGNLTNHCFIFFTCTTMLGRRAIAAPLTGSKSSSAGCSAFAPILPVRPLAIHRWNGFHRTGRIRRTIDLIPIGTDAQSTPKSGFRISAGSPTSFNSQSAGLRTGRPGRPFRPSTVSGTIGYFVTVTQTALTTVHRSGLIALPLAAGATVSLSTFTRMGALGPIAPFTPTTVHYKE